MADMHWAKERAREIEGIFNCTSSREPLIRAVAAVLQAVANECADAAAREKRLYVTDEGKRVVAERIENNIRARFPKE